MASEISSRRLMLTVDSDDLDLVLEALRADSKRRQRAATKAAGELNRERKSGEVKDPRPAAQAIARALAEANSVDSFADLLEEAWNTRQVPALVDLPKPAKRTRKRQASTPTQVTPPPGPLAPAPHRAAAERTTEQAYAEGLAAANRALEIEFSGNSEDEPDPDDVVDVLTEE